ncbi:MAG: FmdB family zinc ribbon protein [Longimicrobiales bacterium]|nr:FmdB family zinc ribbon protein [Longimicrobiales bacterium]
MPTYEYRCPNGHAFELFQKMSDEPGAPCPECGADAERQLSAGAGFLFKGEGFYITDYRSESYRKAAERESATSGGSSEGRPAKDGAGAKDATPKAPDASPSTSTPAGSAGSDA